MHGGAENQRQNFSHRKNMAEFLTTMAKSRAAFDQEQVLEQNPNLEGHCLDPLMQMLAKYRSSADLLDSIDHIYGRLDVDSSGGIGRTEMKEGLANLLPDQIIDFTNDDWHELTEEFAKRQHREDTIEVELTPDDFHVMCLSQLKAYLIRESNKALAGGDNPYDSMILILKWMMIALESNDVHHVDGGIVGGVRTGRKSKGDALCSIMEMEDKDDKPSAATEQHAIADARAGIDAGSADERSSGGERGHYHAHSTVALRDVVRQPVLGNPATEPTVQLSQRAVTPPSPGGGGAGGGGVVGDNRVVGGKGGGVNGVGEQGGCDRDEGGRHHFDLNLSDDASSSSCFVVSG